MRKLLLIAALALPLSAQYLIPVLRTDTHTWALLTPGPNLKLVVNGAAGIIDAAPPVVISPIPTPQVADLAMGQTVIVLAAPGTASAVSVFRDGMYQNGQAGTNAAGAAITPDYTLSADKSTLILAQPGQIGERVIVLLWH